MPGLLLLSSRDQKKLQDAEFGSIGIEKPWWLNLFYFLRP